MIINIQFSHICNASCKFCFHAQSGNFLTNSFISWDIIKKIYNDTLDIIEPIYIVCDVAGEALLDPEYFEKADYLKQNKNVKIILFTNGLILKKFDINDLKKVDFLVLSFLGDASNYETSSKLSLKLFIENVLYLYKNDIKFYIKLTYDKEPYTILNILSKYDIPLNINIDKIFYNGNKKSNIKKSITIDSYPNIKFIFKERSCNIDIITDEITIDSEGNSYVCCFKLLETENKTSKNILTSSLKDLRNYNIEIFKKSPNMCKPCALNNNVIYPSITWSKKFKSIVE
jgi:MoaA/NifB/PqqE/SkfB family radical SAM enzyme